MLMTPEQLMRNARVIPVSQPNKAKFITKHPNGGMQVEFNSGAIVELEPEDKLIQAFVVYTMLADL